MLTRAPAEPYVTGFSTTVGGVDGNEVVLEETYFYAESGGQPADRGTIDGIEVVDVQHRDGAVVHELARDPSFESGDAVDAAVDPEFRTFCRRAHTASHALYGAGRELLEDVGYGGFDISAEPIADADGTITEVDGKVRVDFATPTEIDDETLVEFERLTNQVVWDSRDVTWAELPKEEALSRDDIAFNTKTEEGIAADTVRVVTIEGWDVAACGGTHVHNTREIGPITVLGRSNPGEGLTRVEFAVGPRAIERRATERERATAAANALGTSVDGLPDEVERLQAEHEALRTAHEDLQERLAAARLAELREQTVETDGTTWLVGTLPGLDANALAETAQAVVDGETNSDDGDASADDTGNGDEVGPEDNEVDVAALLNEDGQYLAVATAGDVDAAAIVDDVTSEFGGGGGGGPTLAQGGGLNADADEIVAFLRG